MGVTAIVDVLVLLLLAVAVAVAPSSFVASGDTDDVFEDATMVVRSFRMLASNEAAFLPTSILWFIKLVPPGLGGLLVRFVVSAVVAVVAFIITR